MPGSPDHEVRRPSPRLWRMRCAEVIAAGAAVAILVGPAPGVTLGTVAAVLAVAVVIAGGTGQAASVASPVNASQSEA